MFVYWCRIHTAAQHPPTPAPASPETPQPLDGDLETVPDWSAPISDHMTQLLAVVEEAFTNEVGRVKARRECWARSGNSSKVSS